MPQSNRIRAATDVGGTFTDLVYFRTDPKTGRQEIVTAKSDTTPPDFERGVMNVIHKADLPMEEIAFLAHGTTVVINALTERKGVKTGLITTAGFRDSIEIARGNRPDFFNLFYKKPEPFVPRYLRQEVPGRMSPQGMEREALDLSGLPAILKAFKKEGVQAVAICLLHSYANPAHEQAVLEKVHELWADVAVVASHQITREWREYERSNTTILSAYVQPIAERYLSRLQAGAEAEGFTGQMYIMQSNCGVDSLEHTRKIPITMVESGPASGVWGAAELGRLIERAECVGARYWWHNREMLVDRKWSGAGANRLLDRTHPSIGGLSDSGACARHRRDRAGRRQHRLGGRIFQAARWTQIGGRTTGSCGVWARWQQRHDHRCEPGARAHQPALLLRWRHQSRHESRGQFP